MLPTTRRSELARRRSAVALGALALVAATGCGDRAELRLQQSTAPPAERDMRLNAAEAFHSARDGREHYPS